MIIIIFMQFLSLYPAKFVKSADFDNARKYCEALVPALERIHEETGQYPPDITTLLKSHKPPSLLLKQGYFYYSDGKSYSFRISTGMMMGTNFSSESKQWQPYD